MNNALIDVLSKVALAVHDPTSPQPLCPDIAAFQAMPRQHTLMDPVYNKAFCRILNHRDTCQPAKAWMLSCKEPHAGAWLNGSWACNAAQSLGSCVCSSL